VEITAHSYVPIEETTTQLYSGVLPVGLTTITFNAPMHDLGIFGDANIVTSGANYAILDVLTEGAIELTGIGYTDTKQVYLSLGDRYETVKAEKIKGKLLFVVPFLGSIVSVVGL
jgi:hypothetical protein